MGMPRTTMLVLAGSAVDSFFADLSRLYTRGFLDVLATADGYEVHVAFVSPDGCWRFPVDISDAALAAAIPFRLPEALAYIRSIGVEVMVPQMFCLPGMTSYRALFDVLGIPYVGNPPDVMAIAADKSRARAVVAAAGVSVPAGAVVRSTGDCPLPLPVVVKPLDTDNSTGTSLVRDPACYAPAVQSALRHSTAALVESYVELGREVRCGIVVRDGELVCLPLEEYALDSRDKPIRQAEDKLARAGDGGLYLVAKDPSRAWIVAEDDPVTERVWNAARRCHAALGCRHYSLFDFRVDPRGHPWFLEAGPYCSFAPGSVVATMAAATGVNPTQLFDAALHELGVR